LRPTVLDVLGPDYAPHNQAEIYIDHSVLEGVRVDDRHELRRDAERAKSSTPWMMSGE
jgi:hypothetical protein